MRIIKATYGGVDCTKEVQDRVVNNKLVIRADNNIIGDPRVGVAKELKIDIIDAQNVSKSVIIQEGSLAILPETKSDRLGVFYSNNNNRKIYPAILKSLHTIEEAAQGKADIITCMWEPMVGNPFFELQSWYKSYSHLNQLLQIMQSLYTAKEMGTYKYVSFLEHDVMYPEGYFDYEDFDKGVILTNMNYGGLNTSGWQVRGQNDEPFHQMTMHLEEAIKHCEAILPNALRTNSGMIESQTYKREQWLCKNEAIHINHGYHFTSHNSIYKTSNQYAIHPYWGDYGKYLDLF